MPPVARFRAGQAHVGQPRAVGAAANRLAERLDAHRAVGALRQPENLHARLDDLAHIAIGIPNAGLDGARAVLVVEILRGAHDRGLARLKLRAVVVADDVFQLRLLLVARHLAEVEEALVALGVLGRLGRRKHSGKLHGDARGVAHPVLRAARVDAPAVHDDGRGRRVEVFILDGADRAAVHGVGEIRAEAGNVEAVRAAADLLVRREADRDLPVRDGRVREQALARGQDLGDAGLVVRAEQRVAVGDDQGLALGLRHVGKHLGSSRSPLSSWTAPPS